MSKFRFWATLVTAIILGSVGILLGGQLPMPSPFNSLQSRLFYGLVGILIGLLAFAPLSSLLVKTFTRLLKQLGTKIAAEVANQFTQLASRGWRPWERSGEEMTGFTRPRLGDSEAIILDTSSIIDGRILDVAKAGFLSGLVLLPEFVLTELRQVADSADSLKRNRGRRGFEIVVEFKKVKGIKVEVWDKEVAGKSVDDKLIRLGKILHAKVLTCDFNLNRAAGLNGVRVLNLNDLANALKTLAVPGEKLLVKIIHPGKDTGQGVGYLADGTMVVVKEAVNLIGEEVNIEVGKIIQGPAGRMIFGSLIHTPKTSVEN